MDDVRFDYLARRVAAFHRRRFLGTAMAAFGLLFNQSSASSQPEGIVVLGGTCTVDSECIRGGPSAFCPDVDPVCGNNGFISDGPLNCCLDAYACCATEADCCGELRCMPQGEYGPRCMIQPGTRHVGEVCVTNAECLVTQACNTACVEQRCQCDPPAPRPQTDQADFPLVADDDAALQAAEVISALELSGDIQSMYRSMHPDARAVIPQDAVIGWYRNEFLHFGEPAPQAIKVRLGPWTWEVTGKTYPQSAEVATKQLLDDGTEVWDAVRLVKDSDGNWGWFFGRTRPFIAEQLERFVRADPSNLGAQLGESCTETLDCSQSQAPAQCVDAVRDGVRQRICLHGATGFCLSSEDCLQAEGKTECVGGPRDRYSRDLCLRTEGANCKATRECLDLLTCQNGRCLEAR